MGVPLTPFFPRSPSAAAAAIQPAPAPAPTSTPTPMAFPHRRILPIRRRMAHQIPSSPVRGFPPPGEDDTASVPSSPPGQPSRKRARVKQVRCDIGSAPDDEQDAAEPAEEFPLLALNRMWVDREFVPYLALAFGHLELSTDRLKGFVDEAETWATLHPEAPTVDEELLFERLHVATMYRWSIDDPEMDPYTRLTPLIRYFTRRAMVIGSYGLWGHEFPGSEAYMQDRRRRYPCTHNPCVSGCDGDTMMVDVVPTREILGDALLIE